jgi:predicted GNAT superfamily acetyltransferase
MIIFTTSTTDNELAEIITLQKQNLPANLTAAEMQEQGFVTVVHSLDDLKKMNQFEQHLVIKDTDTIVGYLLAMTKKSQFDIPVLVPMFEAFEQVSYQNKLLADYNFIVVGQVCIDKGYRGKGLLNKSYQAYKKIFSSKYDFAITEIATANQRSLNAHKTVGFREVHQFTDINQIEWSIVLWDWR